MISIVIPTLNEEEHIGATLAALAPYQGDLDVIVADGGSNDATKKLVAQHAWVRLIEVEPGRSLQMNAGARAAHGDVLLFLHADTRLHGNWLRDVQATAARDDFGMGAFRFKLDSRRFAYRIIELGVFVRSHLFRLPYGDQALFVRKDVFLRDGGYPPVPIMEDVELVKRYRKGKGLTLLSHAATSSPRKWERDGIVLRTLTNWKTYRQHRRGTASPQHLARQYSGRDRALILFCKQPVPGRVKTRLGATLGDEAACNVYRDMVLQTLSTAERSLPSQDIFIFYDPPKAEPELMEWLGDAYNYQAQCSGHLGQRMLHAFQSVTDLGYDRIAIIGTDCPALQSSHIRNALEQLLRKDLCIGPTDDGGYYLIAAKQAHAELFADINWSTDTVLKETLEAANSAGLKAELLPKLRDLDTEEDLRHHRKTGSIPVGARMAHASE